MMTFIRNPFHWTALFIALAVFIAVTGCTGTTPSAGQVTPAQTVTSATLSIDIKDFAYKPAAVTVTKGTTVTWVNQDAVQHDVVNLASGSLAEGAYFKSQFLSKGQSFSFRFDNPGTYPYYCTIHPSMKATINVV